MSAENSFQSETFKHLQLSNLDFARDRRESSDPSDYSNQSVVVSNLLSQNDDLNSRLKVLLQRLLTLESELVSKDKALSTIKASQLCLEDQLLIWKEKERVWKERLQKNSIKAEESDSLREQVRLYRFEAEAYQRLKDKLKNQVRPYVKDLKASVQSLSQQTIELQRVVDHMEAQLIETVNKNKTLQLQTQELEHSFQQDLIQITDSFEKERADLKQEIANLKDELNQIRPQAAALGPLINDLDLAKNNEVLLKRQMDVLRDQYTAEADGYRRSLLDLKMELQMARLRAETLEIKNSEITDQRNFYEKQFDQNEADLQRTRFLLSSKSEECDKYKLALTALEKMNYDLMNKKAFSSEP